MDISLTGRVALVTGASRGIGRAIAIALAEAGADIAVNYRRDTGAANETIAAVQALGRKAIGYSASVEIVSIRLSRSVDIRLPMMARERCPHHSMKLIEFFKTVGAIFTPK